MDEVEVLRTEEYPVEEVCSLQKFHELVARNLEREQRGYYWVLQNDAYARRERLIAEHKDLGQRFRFLCTLKPFSALKKESRNLPTQ